MSFVAISNIGVAIPHTALNLLISIGFNRFHHISP